MNEKNKSDEKIKDFSNYLLDIGLLIGSSYNDFVKKFKEINEKEKIISEDEEPDDDFDLIYFKDNVSKTMIKFYDAMNEDKKKLTTFNIFNIYSKNKSDKNNNELPDDNFHIDKNEIIDVEGSDKKPKKIEDKIEYKEERFEITIFSDKNNLILKLSESSEKSEENSKNNIPSKKKYKKLKKNLSSKKNKPKKEEKIELNENCTFQPNIDKKRKQSEKKEKKDTKKISEFFTKLSQKNTKREKDVEDIQKQIAQECPFQPNLVTNKKNKNKKINRKDFEERMKRFEENKKEKEERRKKDEQEEFNKKFPFIPNNNNNKKRNNSFNKSFQQKKNESFMSENVYKRLHDENKLIKKKYEENLQKLLDDIKDRANHPIVFHNDIKYLSKRKERKIYNIKNIKNYFNEKKYFTEEKKDEYKNYNSKRIEELYEEYKKMKGELISKNNKTEANEENKINLDLDKNEKLIQSDIIDNRTTNEKISIEDNNKDKSDEKVENN